MTRSFLCANLFTGHFVLRFPSHLLTSNHKGTPHRGKTSNWVHTDAFSFKDASKGMLYNSLEYGLEHGVVNVWNRG